MNQKEAWINKVMQSLRGQHANVPEGLEQRILQRLQHERRVAFIPVRVYWSAAAALLLLVSLNVASLLHTKAQQRYAMQQSASHAVASEYFEAFISE